MYSTNTKNPSTAVNIFRAFMSDDAQDLLLPVPVLQYYLASGFLVIHDEFDNCQCLADQVNQVQRSHLLLELGQFLPCVWMEVNA
jgi:D-serine deaminase-like pyridoxal phosphate-dependent protein